ncbi:glycosyltransferase [Streptomyces sp. NPDC091268]|uniref:glycosyltransferase n=1 Tax=Streptomyces sp. NPDC091268 TaxID=3365979 RepID=UPI0037F68208
MRVLIVTAGSWGDVAPYTGLGARLGAAGHEVSLATHARFEAAVTAHGLGFRPLPLDPRAELASPAGQRLARSGGGPSEVVRAVRMFRRFMPPLAAATADAVRAGADVLLAAPLAEPLCAPLAEAYGLPCVGAHLQPLAPTRAFPPPVAGTRSYGPYGNRLAARAVLTGMDLMFAGAAASLRRELGLASRPRPALSPARTVHHGFSRHVVPRPADWPPGHRVGGYWWPERPPGWQPEPRLLDFLAAGPPPVFAGFGSFVAGSGADAERLAGLLAAALRKAGVRGIVQSGWSGLRAEGDDLITVGEVPHDWLFPRTAAVVHHAGAGTTAAGLRAGVPAVPVPVQLDQHFWAARLTALGVAPGALRYQRLTVDRLAAAVRTAVTEPSLRTRARRIADALAREDGAAPLLETLAELD